MKALVVRQPWASLIAHGIKTIETRGFAPRTVLQPGDQLAIVAGKTPAEHGLKLGWEWQVGVETSGPQIHADDPESGECPCPDPDEGAWSPECKALNEWHPALLRDAGAHGWSIESTLPLGAVVAVVTFDEALPCVEANPVNLDLGGGPPHWNGSERLLVDGRTDRMWHVTGRKGSDGLPEITDQLPLGDFTPGRYGWLLSNPQRRTHPVPCPAIRPDGSRTVMQGVFTLPDDVLADVQSQLAAPAL